MNESKNEMLAEVSKTKFILNLRYIWGKKNWSLLSDALVQ